MELEAASVRENELNAAVDAHLERYNTLKLESEAEMANLHK